MGEKREGYRLAKSLPKVLYAMTLFSSVIPGLTRNPGGYGSNIDLDSGSEAGVTDKKNRSV